MNATDIDKAILMLTGGISRAAAEEIVVAKMSMTPREAKALVAQAARRLTLAANYNHDAELGTAITRLNDLFKRSLAIQDVKTCLAIQRELNKLMDLYRTPPKLPDDEQGEPGGEPGLVELCRAAAKAQDSTNHAGPERPGRAAKKISRKCID